MKRIVDTEVCKLSNCPFACKGNDNHDGVVMIDGACLKAVVTRKPKSEVCISNVSIRVAKK